MSIRFGVGTLSVLTNNLLTGGAVTTGATSGAGAHQLAISSGFAMIDGVTATVSANAAFTYTEAGATGTGLLIFAYIAAGSTTTATIGLLTASDPLNTASNIPTAIAPLARFSYGTGAAAVSTLVAWSGGSATKVIGKVQNVSINVSYENAQMRGGGDVFPVDTKFFDGACEGSFEFSDPTATQFLLFGGIYASAGASSGTWTLSGTSKPEKLSLVFTNVTDGITSTYSVMRASLTTKTNEFSRTEFMNPSYDFVAQANNAGDVLKIQQ